MRDVAEHAGVSITSFSHIIYQTRPVSDELKQRVLEAMAELGYQPNILARGLRRWETHTIGVIVPDSANPFFADVARGVEDTNFENGYSVILCNTDSDLEKGEAIPGDLSVVGFDDIRLAVYANPPITTISQLKYEMGILATEMLLERMWNPVIPPQTKVLETRLVIRKSTGPNP